MPVAPSSDIMNHILAVSRAETVEEELTETNVSGFVVVKGLKSQNAGFHLEFQPLMKKDES